MSFTLQLTPGTGKASGQACYLHTTLQAWLKAPSSSLAKRFGVCPAWAAGLCWAASPAEPGKSEHRNPRSLEPLPSLAGPALPQEVWHSQPPQKHDWAHTGREGKVLLCIPSAPCAPQSLPAILSLQVFPRAPTTLLPTVPAVLLTLPAPVLAISQLLRETKKKKKFQEMVRSRGKWRVCIWEEKTCCSRGEIQQSQAKMWTWSAQLCTKEKAQDWTVCSIQPKHLLSP